MGTMVIYKAILKRVDLQKDFKSELGSC